MPKRSMRRTLLRGTLAASALAGAAAGVGSGPSLFDAAVATEPAEPDTLPAPPEDGVAAGPMPGEVPPPTDATRAFYGYIGPFFDVQAQTGTVELMQTTLRQASTTTWEVLGLVRNQTVGPVRAVVVTASLKAPNGLELGTVRATTMVNYVRAGEPAPFRLQSSIPAAGIGGVTYAVTFQSASTASLIERNLDMTTYWQVPFGSREPLSEYPMNEGPDSVLSYGLFGTVTNNSGAMRRAHVVAGWLSDSGEVLHLTNVGLVSEGSPPPAALVVNGSADFLYTNSDPLLAPQLHEARLVLWGEGIWDDAVPE